MTSRKSIGAGEGDESLSHAPPSAASTCSCAHTSATWTNIVVGVNAEAVELRGAPLRRGRLHCSSDGVCADVDASGASADGVREMVNDLRLVGSAELGAEFELPACPLPTMLKTPSSSTSALVLPSAINMLKDCGAAPARHLEQLDAVAAARGGRVEGCVCGHAFEVLVGARSSMCGGSRRSVCAQQRSQRDV